MTLTDKAFVLHARPYRESSQLLNFFTRDNGCLSAVARGARGKPGKNRPQPFALLQISWTGKTDLKSLTSAEPLNNWLLRGIGLYCGFYLNELLLRLMHGQEPHETVFDHYHHVICGLAEGRDIEAMLRMFEFSLLNDLGYGFSLDSDCQTGEKIDPEANYIYEEGEGVMRAPSGTKSDLIPGKLLLSMAVGDFSSTETKLSAKRLLRKALRPHLGAKPLMSRELFRGASVGSDQ